jgi:hypothetical protein
MTTTEAAVLEQVEPAENGKTKRETERSHFVAGDGRTKAVVTLRQRARDFVTFVATTTPDGERETGMVVVHDDLKAAQAEFARLEKQAVAEGWKAHDVANRKPQSSFSKFPKAPGAAKKVAAK